MFLWPLETEHRYLQTYTHPSTVNMKRTVGWHQKRNSFSWKTKKASRRSVDEAGML